MALIKCPECSREVSNIADVCPQCGFPIAIHLEKKKAEQLIADEIEAKRIEKEKTDIEKRKGLQEDKSKSESHKPYTAFNEDVFSAANEPLNFKPNYKIILGVLGVVIAMILINIYINKSSAEAKQQKELFNKQKEITQKRNWFNSAKTLIKSNQLRDDELYKAKDSLESIDVSMPEYKEAQELLPSITKRISDVEKANEEKAAKERKVAEDSLYTSGGKRIHAKHPDWSPDDCNTIAKGQINIGMTTSQVAAAWGRPYRINRTTGSYGEHEQWVMHEMGNSYVYFEDGICTTIQN